VFNGGGGWGVFNALFGWTNSATYGTVISYNLYWVVVITGFFLMRFREVKGHWPFMKKPAAAEKSELNEGTTSDQSSEIIGSEKKEPVVREGEVENSREVVG
jgi:high-affinity iron transporter